MSSSNSPPASPPPDPPPLPPPPPSKPRGRRRGRRPGRQIDPPQESTSSGAAAAAPLQPMLLEARGYHLFVIDTFLRIQDQFPHWYHNELLANLRDVYCPFNWTFLSESERVTYGQHAENAISAANSGETVTAAILEGRLELIDITGEEADEASQNQICTSTT